MSLDNNNNITTEIIDVTVEVDTIKKPVISQLLFSILLSDDKIKNINFTLNSEDITIIHKIISYSPEFFNEIDKLINEIIKDGKIDSNDIPNLILLIKKIYELIHNLKSVKLDNDKRLEICKSILKFIIRVLIDERIIVVNNENKQIVLELIDNLIDSCVSLMHFSSNIKNSTCFSYLLSCFGYKK